MSAYRYSWTRAFNVPAQVVGEFFHSLPVRTPEAFIDASKNRRSPTHSLFEWDDSAAAREYRLVQARVIVSSLEVEVVSSKGKAERIRAYIGASDRGSYVASLEATVEELTAAEQECVNHMRRFKSRWRGMQLARDVIMAIQATEARAARKKKATA